VSAAAETLRTLRVTQLAHRDRIEAVLERQSRISDEIDVLAGFVARLPDVRLTVAQSERLRIIAAELMRRAR
jgi:hypothetical protein